MNSPPSLFDRPGTILLDAAMGTRLIARGLDLRDDDPCAWNLNRPDDVLEVHRLDIQAGAEALLTNTFGANRGWLDRFGLADRAGPINQAAVRLAREAAGPDRWVIGCVGPGSSSANPPAVMAQVDWLAESGVDAIVFETLQFPQAEVALRFAGKHAGSLPAIVSFWDIPEGADLARIEDLGARALGINCIWPPERAVMLAERLRNSTRLPIWAKPSGSVPGQAPSTPEELATTAADLAKLGVKFVGGCCGADQIHLAAMRRALDRLKEAGHA